MRKYRHIINLIFPLLLAGLVLTACGDSLSSSDLPAAAGYTSGKTDGTEESEESTEAVTEEKEEKTETVSENTTEEVKAEETKKTAGAFPDKAYADDIDDELSKYTCIKVRSTDKTSGDIVDTSIYKDKDAIVKVSTADHGSEGLIVSDYYVSDGKVVYMKQLKTDIYGIFSTLKEANLEDKEADYTKEVMGKAEEAVKNAKSAKADTLLYGYVGDEQGGVLKNVTVKLRNTDGKYTDQTVTDADGYFTLTVPQKEDTYFITYEYEGCVPTTLNDVHIVPGIPEYSLGRAFVAPAGEGVHETDVYLLNPNAKSPVELKDGEYAAVITSDDPNLKLKLVDLDKQGSETGTKIKFDPSKSKNGYALFVEDTGYIGKEDMAGNIGRTYSTVTIYDKDGIKAAYREPSGRLGTLWKVCTIANDGDTEISGIMYTDSNGWVEK